MLKARPAKKVIIYVGKDHQYHRQALYSAILEFLFYHKVSGAIVTRGIAGFGADHRMHTDRVLALTENLPIKIEFIESPEKADELLPKLLEMAKTGLIEIQDTTILKPSEAPAKSAAARRSAPAVRLPGRRS
jgi:PII-like signaling protein